MVIRPTSVMGLLFPISRLGRYLYGRRAKVEQSRCGNQRARPGPGRSRERAIAKVSRAYVFRHCRLAIYEEEQQWRQEKRDAVVSRCRWLPSRDRVARRIRCCTSAVQRECTAHPFARASRIARNWKANREIGSSTSKTRYPG